MCYAESRECGLQGRDSRRRAAAAAAAFISVNLHATELRGARESKLNKSKLVESHGVLFPMPNVLCCVVLWLEGPCAAVLFNSVMSL